MKRSKRANIYLIILSIVTAIVVLFGIYKHVFDASRLFPRISLVNGVHVVNNVGSAVTGQQAVEGDVSVIDVDLAAADLQIVVGNRFEVSYAIPEKLVPSVEVTNGVLHIGQNHDAALGIGSLGSDYKITLTIPENVTLKDISLNVDMGNVELKDELHFDGNLKIIVNMGNVEVWNTACEDMDFDVDMGNLTVYDCTCDVLNANVDLGNLEVNSYFESATAKCSLGDLEIYSQNSSARVDAKTDLGSEDVKWAE